MGLLVQQTFELPSGIILSEIYLKLTNVTVNFRNQNYVEMHCVFENYYNREAMIANKTNVQSFLLPNNLTFLIAKEHFNTVDLGPWLYLQYSKFLNTNGYGHVSAILEDGQSLYTSDVSAYILPTEAQGSD